MMQLIIHLPTSIHDSLHTGKNHQSNDIAIAIIEQKSTKIAILDRILKIRDLLIAVTPSLFIIVYFYGNCNGIMPEAPSGQLASPMMNGSSCRPPAGKKLKRQVHPSPPAPRKIELEANKKANCFLNGNGWLIKINMKLCKNYSLLIRIMLICS